MGCRVSTAIWKGRCYRCLGIRCHPEQHSSSAGTAASPTLDTSQGPNPAQRHSEVSPKFPRALSEAGYGLCSVKTLSCLQGAHGGDCAVLSTVGTGPGHARPLPATGVWFLCIEWGCSWCSWPAMQKGHRFNFGLIFIEFRQCGIQSCRPW